LLLATNASDIDEAATSARRKAKDFIVNATLVMILDVVLLRGTLVAV
jgi:hypothetical protein